MNNSKAQPTSHNWVRDLTLALAFVVIGIATLTLGPVSSQNAAAPGSQTLGSHILVGTFKLHVQTQRGIVKVQERGGVSTPSVPSTQLIANFVNWDQQSSIVTINVAISNKGATSLFGPLQTTIVNLASPKIIAINADSGTGPGSWGHNYDTALLGGNPLLSSAETSDAKSWLFESPTSADFQVDVDVFAGVPLAPNAGGTIQGPNGTSVTVQPGSIPYEVLIDITPADPSAIKAPLGDLEFVGAVNVTFQPTATNASLIPPKAPLILSIPAPANGTATNFVVGQERLSDFFDGTNTGLREQLIATDTASLVQGNILTQANILPGIFEGGLFVFVANQGSGFATGTVTDAGSARPGVVVSNSTNTLVSVTNSAGRYTLYINGGPFTVTGFDPLRGSRGSASGNIAVSGSTVTTNLSLIPLTSAPSCDPTVVTCRAGIRNGGFELGQLTSHWVTSGAASVRTQFGPTSTGVIIRPTEGRRMADVNTGLGSVGSVGSSLKQRFIIPAGVRTLRLDFNFISEEFPEFVGTVFNDAFRAIISTPNGQSTFAQVSVNNSGGFQLIGDCGFPEGDTTCGQTGWREGSVDVSNFAGTNTPIAVELLFTANDAGDNIYDTHVLVDNIRFSTVWVDAKIVAGAGRSAGGIEQEVQSANEILSQAGINVRLRNVQTTSADTLLDTDITFDEDCRFLFFFNCKFVRTEDETVLLSLLRSSTAADVNVYYVQLMSENNTPGTAAALAIGPDDYHDVGFLTNAGVIIQDLDQGGCPAGGQIIAHELGHLLISPQRAGDALEHTAGTNNFMGGNCATPLVGVITRAQSANINRVGAPLLRP